MSEEVYKAAIETLMCKFTGMFCDSEYTTLDFNRTCTAVLSMCNRLCTEEENRNIYDRYQTLKRWFREDRERLKQ